MPDAAQRFWARRSRLSSASARVVKVQGKGGAPRARGLAAPRRWLRQENAEATADDGGGGEEEEEEGDLVAVAVAVAVLRELPPLPVAPPPPQVPATRPRQRASLPAARAQRRALEGSPPLPAPLVLLPLRLLFAPNPGDNEKKDKDKAPSPFEASKKDAENGSAAQQNGIVQNGLGDDDKGFKWLAQYKSILHIARASLHQSKHANLFPRRVTWRRGSPARAPRGAPDLRIAAAAAAAAALRHAAQPEVHSELDGPAAFWTNAHRTASPRHATPRHAATAAAAAALARAFVPVRPIIRVWSP
ncbi:Protein of unknown function [Gryllus bimaculatus]|nr:Protein of unknown function [Gryllus bimaculatus]